MTIIEEQFGSVPVANNISHKSHMLVNVSFPHGSFPVPPIVQLSVFLDQKQALLNQNNRTNIHTFVANVITTTTSGFCAIVRRVSEKMLIKGWNNSQREEDTVKLNWYATLPTNYLKYLVTQQQLHYQHLQQKQQQQQLQLQQQQQQQKSSSSDSSSIGSSSGGSSGQKSRPDASEDGAQSAPPPIPSLQLTSSLNEHHYHSSILIQGHAGMGGSGGGGGGSSTSSSGGVGVQQDNAIIVVTVPIPPVSSSQQQSSPTAAESASANARIAIPNVVVTAHAVNSQSEEVFVPMLREVYADRFVVVLRRVAFDPGVSGGGDSSNVVSSPGNTSLGGGVGGMQSHGMMGVGGGSLAPKQENILKLNWSAFYYNHSQGLYDVIQSQSSNKIPVYRQAATAAIGHNNSALDGVRRQIYLLQFTNKKIVTPDCVLCTPRCDPNMPGNSTVCSTISQVQGDSLWVCARQVSPVRNIKDWNFNLYMCYVSMYRNLKLFTESSPSSSSGNEDYMLKKFEDIPFSQQLYICNRASGYVLDVTDSQTRPYTKIALWSNRIFLTSQNQRFYITEDGFIVSALNNNLVLECIKDSNQSIFINQKRENDNLTQKWIFKRVDSSSADHPENPTPSSSMDMKNTFNTVVDSLGSTVNNIVGASSAKNEAIIIASAADPSYVLESSGTQKGASCILQKMSGNANQQWNLRIAANSFF